MIHRVGNQSISKFALVSCYLRIGSCAIHRVSPASSTFGERANPPISTVPGPIEIPSRRPNQHLISYAFQSGKAYFNFYKAGVKSVWGNRKLAIAVKDRLRQNGQPAAQTRAGMDVSHIACTRAEYQLLRRSHHDMRRVPAFAILLLLFGEWLPLVVIFVTKLVPLPCRIPGQIQAADRAREDQRRSGRRQFIDGSRECGLQVRAVQKGDTAMRMLDTLRIDLHQAAINLQHRPERVTCLYLHHALSNFNIRSALWERTYAYAFMPALPWTIRLRRHLMHLMLDDALLVRDGGADVLSPVEVRIACSDRGIDTLERNDADLRFDLRSWLQMRRAGHWLELFSGERQFRLK